MLQSGPSWLQQKYEVNLRVGEMEPLLSEL